MTRFFLVGLMAAVACGGGEQRGTADISGTYSFTEDNPWPSFGVALAGDMVIAQDGGSISALAVLHDATSGAYSETRAYTGTVGVASDGYLSFALADPVDGPKKCWSDGTCRTGLKIRGFVDRFGNLAGLPGEPYGSAFCENVLSASNCRATKK